MKQWVEWTGSNASLISFLMMWSLIGLGLHFHLAPAIVSGLFALTACASLSGFLERRGIEIRKSRIVSAMLIATLSVGFTLASGAAIAHAVNYLSADHGKAVSRLLSSFLQQANEIFPVMISDKLPDSVGELSAQISEIAKSHASDLAGAGGAFAKGVILSVMGIIIGVLGYVTHSRQQEKTSPFMIAIRSEAKLFSDNFSKVVFAQIKISAINTFFTALFLLVAFPLFNIHIPFRYWIVGFTFLLGLIPIIGNLLSNSMICLAGASVSLYVGLVALLYLVVLHKLEYFLNAKIVGSDINSNAWEILLWMIAMEALFGVPGVFVAPVMLAWTKASLKEAGLF